MPTVTSGVQTVTATINGQTYNLTYNSTSGKWEATITAPSTSSYNNNAGHYYPVTLTATDVAGNSVSANDQHSTLGNSLKLKVKETTAPTVSNVSPSNNSYLATSTPTITAELRDNDSGVDISTLSLKIDNVAVSSGITTSQVSGGYNISYTPASALADGAHTIKIKVSDNDGNESTEASVTINIATTAPTLTITSPADNLATKTSSLTVSGTTNTDATVTVKLNSGSAQSVTVGSGGAFSKTITLSTEGENTITIVATNPAGVTTTVTRTVIYDITAPVFQSIVINPNPATTGNTYTITVEVTD